ncbi:hypothetical protein Tco_0483149, partial [Tanacetum coccineum]
WRGDSLGVGRWCSAPGDGCIGDGYVGDGYVIVAVVCSGEWSNEGSGEGEGSGEWEGKDVILEGEVEGS